MTEKIPQERGFRKEVPNVSFSLHHCIERPTIKHYAITVRTVKPVKMDILFFFLPQAPPGLSDSENL